MVEKEKMVDLEEELEDEEDTQKDKFLTFHIANEDYAIEIRHVKEIIRIQKITEIPDTISYLKGVINLRGKVIPVIDVRLRFALDQREYDDRTCIVVVNLNEVETGLIVDRVSEVLTIPENKIDAAPKSGKKEGGKFIQGMGKVGDDVKIILNVDRLLNEDDMAAIKEMANT